MALVGIELEMLVSEPDVLTTGPPAQWHLSKNKSEFIRKLTAYITNKKCYPVFANRLRKTQKPKKTNFTTTKLVNILFNKTNKNLF